MRVISLLLAVVAVLGGFFLFSRGGAFFIFWATLLWLLGGAWVILNISYVPPQRLQIVESCRRPRVLRPGCHWVWFFIERIGLSLPTWEWSVPLLEGNPSILLKDGKAMQIQGCRIWIRLLGAPEDWSRLEEAANRLRQVEDVQDKGLKEAVKPLCEALLLNLLQGLTLAEVIDRRQDQEWLTLFPVISRQLETWGLEATRLNFSLGPKPGEEKEKKGGS